MSINHKRFLISGLLLATLCSYAYSQPRWIPQISGTNKGLQSVAFFDSMHGITVGDYATVLHTTDGGINWLPPKDDYPFINYDHMRDIAILDSGSSFIVSDATGIMCFDGGCGQLFHTSNRGIAWSVSHFSFVGGLVGGPSISFANSRQGIICGYGWDFAGELYSGTERTNDGGKSWLSLWPVVNNHPMRQIIRDVSFLDSTFCIAISDSGYVYRHLRDSIINEYDGYSFWEPIDTLFSGLTTLCFIDTLVGFLSRSNEINKTTDGGLSWQWQFNSPHNINSIYFLTADRGYMCGDYGLILPTTNGGNNWNTMTSGTTEHLHDIFFTDPNHGWAAGDDGTILKYGDFLGCNISRREINFGNLIERETRTDSIILNNTGTGSIFISEIISDNNEFVVNPVSLTLPPGIDTTVTITFSPTSPGSKTGHITFIHNALSSPDTIFVEGNALNYDTTTVELSDRWNLVSNPRIVPNDSVQVLFRSAIYPAYQYDQNEGYQGVQRILNGMGYWLKYDSSQNEEIEGVDLMIDTVEVKMGWNLIGTITKEIVTGTIIQDPPNIVISDYFTYASAYIPVTTLIPGKAYWIKVKQNGRLILIAPS